MLGRGEGGGVNSGIGTVGLDAVVWVPQCSCVSKMWWGTGDGQGSDVSRRRGSGGAEQPQEGCRWAEPRQRGGAGITSTCSAVSWIKQSSFLCTDMAQRKMQQKGKNRWKRQARRCETPWCLGI